MSKITNWKDKNKITNINTNDEKHFPSTKKVKPLRKLSRKKLQYTFRNKNTLYYHYNYCIVLHGTFDIANFNYNGFEICVDFIF